MNMGDNATHGVNIINRGSTPSTLFKAGFTIPHGYRVPEPELFRMALTDASIGELFGARHGAGWTAEQTKEVLNKLQVAGGTVQAGNVANMLQDVIVAAHPSKKLIATGGTDKDLRSIRIWEPQAAGAAPPAGAAAPGATPAAPPAAPVAVS